MITSFASHPVGGWVPIVIVGAGAVGLCLGVHLTRKGHDVLVLEAGPASALEAPQDVFVASECVGRPFGGLNAGRLRALGGTTNLWGGQLVAFDPIVFEDRDWLPESGWPIGPGDLRGHYESALDLLGLRHRLEDAHVWHKLRVSPPATGSELDLYLARWTPEPNLAHFFGEDIRRNPRLTVLTDAPVTVLKSAGGDPGMVNLVIGGPGGETHELRAGAVILANGTFEIARLLLSPMADAAPAPWSQNAWLGRGFVDHLDAFAGNVTLLDRKRFYQVFDAAVVDGLKYLPKLKLSEEAQRQLRLLGIAGHFVLDSGAAEQLAAFKQFARRLIRGELRPELLADIGTLKMALPATAHYLLRRRVYNPGHNGIRFRVSTEQIALAESRVTLTDRRDSLGMPTLALDWRVHGAELATMSLFARLADDYLRRAGLAAIDIDPLLRDNDPAFLDKVEDGFHHMGMARMGADPEDGVVDTNLKVFGTHNLFVAGAATFRSTGFANPTLTAIALGLRLADQLAHTALPAA